MKLPTNSMVPPGAASPARGEGGLTRGRTLGEGGKQGKVRGQGPAMRNPAGESSFSIHFWVGFSLTKTNQLLGVVFFFIKITSQTWRFPFVGLALVMIINHYEHHQNHNSSSVFSYKIHFSGISIVNQPFHPLIDELYIRYKQFCGIFHYKR